MTAEELWDRLFTMDVGDMTENERVYHAVNVFFCEWANGFLSLYFYNTGGEEVGYLEKGLTAFGAGEEAQSCGRQPKSCLLAQK